MLRQCCCERDQDIDSCDYVNMNMNILIDSLKKVALSDVNSTQIKFHANI